MKEATKRKKKEIDPALLIVLVVSGALHLIVALIFGSFAVYKTFNVEGLESNAPLMKNQYEEQTKAKYQPNVEFSNTTTHFASADTL